MLNQPRVSATKVSAMLGIITALPQEARTLTKQQFEFGQPLSLAENILLIISGMGADNASNAAQKLLERGASKLLSWGTAGGLDPQLTSGTLVLPKNIIQLTGDHYSVDRTWHQQCLQQLSHTKTPITADLIHANEVLATPTAKVNVFNKTGAVAADMESYAIAQVAHAANVPFLTVRTIADPASARLPKTAINAVDQFGRVRVVKLLQNIVTHPSECYRLCLLGHHFAKACNRLKKTGFLLKDKLLGIVI